MNGAGPLGRGEVLDPAEAAEAARLHALDSTGVLDTAPEQAFDDLTALAARLCRTPIALVSLVAESRQWFLSRVGLERRETPRAHSFCAHALTAGDLLVVPDARADPRFARNPLVVEDPFLRFYAGAPLVTRDGFTLGTLCVLDTEARTLAAHEADDLRLLARQVVAQLELRRHARALTAEMSARRESRKELRARARLTDGLLTHTDALVYAKDLSGRFVLTNAAIEDVLAVPGGLLGRTDHELFPAADAASYRANDTRVTTLGRREVVTEELRHPDGSTHTYRSTKFPLTDDAGTVFGLGGVSADVTELFASRAAHEAAEQRWRALVEHSPVAVAVIGADGRFAYANPQAVALYGAPGAAQLVGQPAAVFVPAGDEAATAALFGEVLRGGPPLRGHRWTLRRLDGALLTVEVHAAGVVHDGASAVQVELRDVTVAAAAQQALAASEQRFRAIFADSPVAMALSDSAGRWVQVNAAFERLMGVGEGDLLGVSGLDVVHPDDQHLVAASEAGQADSPDGIHRLEIRVRRPDGAQRWVWVSITPTPGPDGEVFTLAIAVDVTARKDAETALQESEAELAAIATVARCVQDGTDPRPVVARVVRELAGAASVSVLEAVDGRTLVVTACAGGDGVGLEVPLDEGSMIARVWSHGQVEFLADAGADPRVDPALLALDASVSALWQPVVVAGEVHALLAVTWRHRVADLDTRAARVVRVIADETGSALQATRLRRELERTAATDPLTGSLNRRAWDTRLLALAEAARTSGAPLTVALVDLDHFKLYNDTWGHGAGDDLLRDFADAARACLRKDDVFARWGGEEFVLALPDTTPEQAAVVLDRVRTSVPDGRTCSVGHTTWRPGEAVTSCIARADDALYDAKRGGRDRLATR